MTKWFIEQLSRLPHRNVLAIHGYQDSSELHRLPVGKLTSYDLTHWLCDRKSFGTEYFERVSCILIANTTVDERQQEIQAALPQHFGCPVVIVSS